MVDTPDMRSNMAPVQFLNGLGPNTTTSMPERNNSPAANTEVDLTAIYKRYEQFVLYDQEKSKFMHVSQMISASTCAATDWTTQELVTRVEQLSLQNQALKAQRQRDIEFVATWQQEKTQYEKIFKTIQREMVLFQTDQPIRHWTNFARLKTRTSWF